MNRVENKDFWETNWDLKIKVKEYAFTNVYVSQKNANSKWYKLGRLHMNIL